jgi:DNA-binding SARP family transcriptional activator
MAMADRLNLFGQPRLCGPSRTVDLHDGLPGYLIVFLAFRGDWVARDALAGMFWPDRANADALHNLRANLHRARALLEHCGLAGALDADARRVRLTLATDVADFRAALGSADWLAAVDLHGAPLLAAWRCGAFALFEEWAAIERSALARAWSDAALKAAQQLRLSGRARRAAEIVLRLLRASDEPTEEAVQALLRLAADADCGDAALAQYERLERWLRDEQAARPQPQTLALLRALHEASAAAGPAAARLPRGLLLPARLVGRDKELERLQDPGLRVAILTGEPGVGKTRLLEEALPRASWVACREGLDAVPFAPLAEWLADQRDSLPEVQPFRRELARLVPELAGGEQLPPADPLGAKGRLLAALAGVLEARGRPVVFDDLQWADPGTLELVALLAQRGAVPLRLAFRSGESNAALDAMADDLAALPGSARIGLEAWSAAELLQLLAVVSRAPEPPALFGAWLHQRTGGNPFFVLQSLRALFESGQLRADPEGWSSALDDLTTNYSELRIPQRVADLIRRRLLALPEAARRVLGVAAVAGGAPAVVPLAAAAELSPLATAQAVAELEARALLRDGRFVHDLVRQSVYGALPRTLRTALHAQVAQHFAGVLHAERLAAHWWEAGNSAAALQAIRQATAAQRRAGLHEAALALIASALERSAGSGERAMLLAIRARIALERGEFDLALADANAVLGEAAVPFDRAEALLVTAAVHMQQGRLDAAGRALADVADCDPDHQGLWLDRARLAQLDSRVADVIPELERHLARLRRTAPGDELLQALCSLGSAHAELGLADRSLPLLFEAYRLAGRLGARYVQVEAAIGLLWSLSAVGRNEEAVQVAQEALALGEFDCTPTLRNNLSWSLRELGRIEQASVLCEQLVAGADPTLAVVAHARLIEMRRGAAGEAYDAGPPIDALIAACATTDVYVAHAAAAKAVACHGDASQLERMLPYLQPQRAIDPWLHQRLSEALAARGVDPVRYVGPAPGAE